MSRKERKAKKESKVRAKAKAWNEALQNAYAMGYQDGYNSYENLPKGKGVIVAATAGYENGATAHKKRVKNTQKVQKIDDKTKRVSERLTKKGNGKMRKNKKRRAFYEKVRFLRQQIAEKNNALALENEEFRKALLNKEFLKRQLCDRVVWEDTERANEYRAEIELADKKLNEILSDMKLTWVDLTVQCRCQKCFDTGRTDEGDCDCYPGDDWE